MFSENQIKEIVKSAIESGEIAYEGTSVLPEEVEFSEWALHRAIKDGNILWVIISGVIKNNSTTSTKAVRGLIDITLPEDISSKIYRYNGVPINQQASGDVIETNIYQSGSIRAIALTSPSLNVLHCELGSTINVPANGTIIVDTRIPIFLDIGSN